MILSDFISFFALFLSIFATIFSVITFVKELHIEDKISHLHKHNLNITSIVRLDKDISHLFKTLGMEKNRALRLRQLINANASATFTEGERGLTEPTRGVFQGNATSKISTTRAGGITNSSSEKN